ncbi:Hypothetical protein Minf_0855 [Methylacidiphilum infernorum V4]|uniref:Uncharacterized protein n=1 Tax=Methylacidiphilum infernorum (isolate V4) TaxID=481448 RepID=B3E1B4_METI4|nr:Hypothetical protein Minf_0855 [Methylacidiphilum infernorum V4]
MLLQQVKSKRKKPYSALLNAPLGMKKFPIQFRYLHPSRNASFLEVPFPILPVDIIMPAILL